MSLMRRLKPTPKKALLLAGLSLFGLSPLRAEDALAGEEPTRKIVVAVSPTPYPTATAVPSVRPEELAKVAAGLKAELDVAAKRGEDSTNVLMARLNGLSDKIDALTKVQGDQQKELQSLGDALDASQKKSDDAVKKVQEISQDIQTKGERLESVLDLMNTLKRDVNDNSHEIADAKSELDKVELRTRVKADDSDWWDQVVSWHYLPVAAVVIGAVALGIAASK